MKLKYKTKVYHYKFKTMHSKTVSKEIKHSFENEISDKAEKF